MKLHKLIMLGGGSLLAYTGCFDTRTPLAPDQILVTSSVQPGQALINWHSMPAPESKVNLSKKGSNHEFIALELIGRDTLFDTLSAMSGSKVYQGLKSMAPYCAKGKLYRDGKLTHQGQSIPVFLDAAGSISLPLILNPLFGTMEIFLGASLPGFLENSSLVVKALNQQYSNPNRIKFDVPVDSVLPCSVFVVADFFGHKQQPAFKGFMELKLESGKNANYTTVLNWTNLSPLTGTAAVEIRIVAEGIGQAELILKDAPIDSDKDGIPDAYDMAPNDTSRLAGSKCTTCPYPAPDSLVNLFYNPSPQTQAFPRVGDHSRGWGGGSLSGSTAYDLTDFQSGYTNTWARGLAFSGGLTGWAGEACGERFVEMELGDTYQIHAVNAYWHGDYHIPATFKYEVFSGQAWEVVFSTREKNGDQFVVDSLEYKGTGWGSKPTVVHFQTPAVGNKVRLTLNNCEMVQQTTDSHGWLYSLEVWGKQD